MYGTDCLQSFCQRYWQALSCKMCDASMLLCNADPGQAGLALHSHCKQQWSSGPAQGGQGADSAQDPELLRDMVTTLELALKEVLVTAILSL